MLKEDIQNAITKAMKEGQELICVTLRMLFASIVFKEKEKRYKTSKQKPELDENGLGKESQLTNEEVLDVIASEIKKRRDAVDLYISGGRQELADKEKKEIEILQKYLPPQLSEQEIKDIISKTIEEIGAKEMKDMGKVMASLMPKIKGKAESGLVSKIIKDSLMSK